MGFPRVEEPAVEPVGNSRGDIVGEIRATG
jgi:hypothetical protein